MIGQCRMQFLFHPALIFLLINLFTNDAVQFNHQCTFSLGTCDWNIGRRWQVKALADDSDDQVLTAADRNSEDREKGFTDVIRTPWLYSTPICSEEIRLTFQYNIENEHDQIEVFLLKKTSKEILSLGQWRAITNEKISEDIESFWQQANLTFKAEEIFQVEIEVRHFPESKLDSTTWFALDDILIENCPNRQPNTSPIPSSPSLLVQTTPSTTSSTISSANTTTSTLDEFTSQQNSLSLLSFILYTISTLIGLILIVIILALLISKYHRHCLPKSTLSKPILNHHYHSSRRDHSHHLDPDTRTIITTIR